jgi:ABC-2 type transport system ATP-binding protein
VISARDLGRRFGDFVAVEHVTFEVAPGEVFGLLGPNGAGKTTTMRMLTGLVAPSSGDGEVAGISVTRDPDGVRQVVGILTETPGLYVRLDALENLRFFARLHGVKNPEPKIEQLLRRFGLWERRREPVGSYSKGMRQKLAIARAVVHEPKVVILDEPTSALDPESALVVRALVAELRDERRTIVLCTHNLDEAERLCHRIAVIKRTVLRVDSPAALRSAIYGRATIVRVRTLTDGMIEAVRAVPGVASLEVSDGTLIAACDPEAANPAIARALLGAGAELLSLAEQHKTLEDVYLELVREPAS